MFRHRRETWFPKEKGGGQNRSMGLTDADYCRQNRNNKGLQYTTGSIFSFFRQVTDAMEKTGKKVYIHTYTHVYE